MKSLFVWLVEPLHKCLLAYMLRCGLVMYFDFGSDAPDYSGMNRAAEASAQVSRDALNWFQQEYARTAPDRAAAEQRANAVSDAQLTGMRTATRLAEEADQRNKTVFQPLEDKLVGDAKTYDTPERRAEAAARAAADVEGSFGIAQADLNRALMRSGADPAASASMLQQAALAKAKARAGATTGAAQNIEQQGYARMMDAASLGRGLPGTQATQQQIATQSGNSSAANAQQALQAQMSGAGLMSQGFNTALQGNAQAGQLYGQVANLQAQQSNNDGLWGAIGGVAGSMLGGPAGGVLMKSLTSDRNVKKNTGKPADADKALAEVNALPVEEGWQYDLAKGGPDDGGVRHTGPMAQDVRAVMGEKTAPGGKAIDVVSMNGKILAGMQALTKRVKKLEQQEAA